MSWYTPPCFYTFSTGWVSMQLFDQAHHPHISNGFVENIITCLVSVLFMECASPLTLIKITPATGQTTPATESITPAEDRTFPSTVYITSATGQTTPATGRHVTRNRSTQNSTE